MLWRNKSAGFAWRHARVLVYEAPVDPDRQPKVSIMTAKKNAIAKDLRSPKYRPRVVKSKKAYLRRPKHPARAADAVSGRVMAAAA